jgi:UDP-arabinose 4-epimerase
MKKVLVTGGAGYIGAHTSKLLAASGYEPVCYDNLSTGHADFVKWGPLEIGDLHDLEKLTRVISSYQPIAVIHFAASAYVGESIVKPLKYYRNNVGGTLSLLEAMRLSGLENIVFSSTCATYGTPTAKLLSESCPQVPINPYGHSKLLIEQILRDLSARVGLNHISLRYFNAAGADKDGEIGEKHDPEPHLIPLAIRSAIGGPALKIFGTDFPTPDGTAVRDYIHVEDLGRAHILALEYLLAGGTSDFVNLGTGTGNSLFRCYLSPHRIPVTIKQLVSHLSSLRKLLKGLC